MSQTGSSETVVSFVDEEGLEYDIDHLGATSGDWWGRYTVYRNGKQVARFTRAEPAPRRGHRPDRPAATDQELIMLARAALSDTGSSSHAVLPAPPVI